MNAADTMQFVPLLLCVGFLFLFLFLFLFFPFLFLFFLLCVEDLIAGKSHRVWVTRDADVDIEYQY